MAVNLVKKPNSKSVVWKYFGIRANESGIPIPRNEKKPLCRTCNKEVPCKDGNTSNVFTHLQDAHPMLYTEAMNSKETATSNTTLRDPKQLTLQSVVDHGLYYDPKSPQAQQLNHAAIYFLSKDMQSYNTVEKPGFKAMITKSNPRYKVPSRKYFADQEVSCITKQKIQ